MSSHTAFCLVIVLGVFLQACSGGSGGGASNREIDLNADVGSAAFVYSGPAPASEEIQNFKREFFDPLAGNDRCGQCHTPGGSSGSAFVNQQDVNAAWQVARSVVNLDDPTASAAVLRVANGHNCWLGADQTATCATTLTGYVERWANGVSVFQSEVRLLPRRPVNVAGTRVLPQSVAEAEALGVVLTGNGELLSLLQTYCADCHAENATVPQVPYFGSSDMDIAYASLRGAVDLVAPEASRVVRRLAPESHNCWDDCGDNADAMRRAVERLALVIPETQVDPALLISQAQVLSTDGIVANSGGRYETNLIAKWEFREGSGTTTADTSGVLPEIPLALSGNYQWMASWGLRLVNGKAQGSVSGSSKLHQLITGTGEYTVEAWVAPNNVSQEDAWIVGYAGGPDARNLLLSQTLYNYEAYNRSSVTEDNNAGEPALVSDDDDELAQATLQHVVLTYDPINGRQLYVNGESAEVEDEAGGGLLNNWSELYALVLGNDTSNARPWVGAIRMVAIHNASLTSAQVQQNFDVGVGQKYFLMFSVAEQIDEEGSCHDINAEGARTNYCYLVFTVSQFDDASYLFESPFFANINPSGGGSTLDVQGIRIGINGKLASVGQAFTNVNASASANLGSVSAPLSTVGTIVPLENGADQDAFFLAFDGLNGNAAPVDEGVRQPYRYALATDNAPEVGVRTFDEINASFSALTGVPTGDTALSPTTGTSVAATYASLRRALPGVADFQGFMSSHHMAATQLASAYCDALVQNPQRRRQVFPSSFNFAAPVADAQHDWRNDIAAPLVDRATNTGLLPDSVRSAMLDELELLITDDRDLKPYVFLNGAWVPDPNPAVHDKRDGLIYCRNDEVCPASRTGDVVKAVCTAVLGSAAVLSQ
ncbi:MAG: LamG domain-containing protein [Pseudomonadota bacterium]